MSWKHIDTSIDDAISELAKAIGDGGEEGMSLIIPSGADLNTYKESGIYTAAGNSTITNKPTDATFFGLLVIRRAPVSGYATLICYAGTSSTTTDGKPRAYIRHYSTNKDSWSDWLEYMATVVKLNGDEDLNTLKFSGFYTCAGSNTCTNVPVSGGKTFGLQVVRLAPTTDYLMQFCYSTSATQGHYSVWCRCLAGTTWTAWEKMYTYGELTSAGSSGGGSSSGGITAETDPIFSASAAATITQAMITAWNNKGTSNLTLGTTADTAAAGNHNHDGVYLKTYTELYQGTVKKVNNTSPDANGNVSLTIPSAVTDSTVAGWGYIKGSTLASNANLNSYTSTGFYIAPNNNTITNRPGTSTSSFGLFVIKRNPTADYVTQIAFYGGADTIIQYERICTNGTWSAWYDISLNNYYTKSEIDSLVGNVETLINAL